MSLLEKVSTAYGTLFYYLFLEIDILNIPSKISYILAQISFILSKISDMISYTVYHIPYVIKLIRYRYSISDIF